MIYWIAFGAYLAATITVLVIAEQPRKKGPALWRGWTPFLPPGYDNLDPDGPDHHDPGQEPAMGTSHGFPPSGRGVGNTPGAVAIIGGLGG